MRRLSDPGRRIRLRRLTAAATAACALLAFAPVAARADGGWTPTPGFGVRSAAGVAIGAGSGGHRAQAVVGDGVVRLRVAPPGRDFGPTRRLPFSVDPTVLLHVSVAPGGGVLVSASSAGGTEVVRVARDGRTSRPRLLSADPPEFIAALPDGGLLFARSRGDGRNEAVQVTPDGVPGRPEIFEAPPPGPEVLRGHVVIAPDGAAAIPWTRRDGSLVVARRPPGGPVGPAEATGLTPAEGGFAMAFTASGALLLATGTGERRIAMAEAAPGAPWTRLADIGSPGERAVALAADGEVVRLVTASRTRVRVATRTAAGARFGGWQTLSRPGGSPADGVTAASAPGRTVVAWRDEAGAVHAATTGPDGRFVTPAALLSTLGQFAAHAPSLSVTPTGRFDTAWPTMKAPLLVALTIDSRPARFATLDAAQRPSSSWLAPHGPPRLTVTRRGDDVRAVCADHCWLGAGLTVHRADFPIPIAGELLRPMDRLELDLSDFQLTRRRRVDLVLTAIGRDGATTRRVLRHRPR